MLKPLLIAYLKTSLASGSIELKFSTKKLKSSGIKTSTLLTSSSSPNKLNFLLWFLKIALEASNLLLSNFDIR